MTTVIFKLSEPQEQEVKSMMKEEGYNSRAEFFRFLLKFYKYNKPQAEKNFELTANELAQVLRKLDKAGKLGSSIDDQLIDV